MALLEYAVLLMLWGSCSAQDCGPPLNIPTAEFVGEWDKASYPHGTEATYTCRPGYIKVGRIIWKCLEGLWKEITPAVKCRNKPCGHPGDLLYGSFELTHGTDFVFGARVEYQCDDGYQMASRLNYRECIASGWSNYVPQCEVRKCLPVQPPQNGRIVMTGIYDLDEEYSYGHIMRFECDSPNYKLSGPKEIYCLKTGEWSAGVPECEVISCQVPSIPNGKMLSRLSNKKRYENKERIQYECNPGYRHESRGYSECTENGWNPAPSCIEIVCSFQNVVNGNLQPQKNVYRENDKVGLICNTGYQPEYKDNFPKCTKTGWSPPLTCVPKQCNFPEIENGRLHQTYYTTFKYHYFPMRKGRQIDYMCKENFLTEKGTTWGRIECTDEGWSPVPKCIKRCEQFQVVNGYSTSSTQIYYTGNKAKYNCYLGYSTPEGMNSGEIECLENGWSIQPKCIKTCTKPSLQHGRYSDKPLFMAGDILQYECDEGYMTLDRNIMERSECTETGWKNIPMCTEITCSVEDEILHGSSTPQKQEYKNGHVLKFFCDENYSLKGEELRQCYYFGWFPKALPTCEEITCKMSQRKWALLSPSLKIYKNLDTVKISCEDGYKLSGSELSQCYYFGWFPKLSTCQGVGEEEQNTDGNQDENHAGKKRPKPETDSIDRNSTKDQDASLPGKKRPKPETDSVDRNSTKDQDASLPGRVEKCPPPPQLPDAETVPNKDYYNGDNVNYTCKENYQLQGRKEIQCKNEKWTSPPRCIEITKKCARPPNPDNTRRQQLYGSGSDSVHFACREKFRLHGPETIQCNNGSWTSPPQCIGEQPCKEPQSIRNGKTATPLKPGYSDGDTVIYECDSGYHMEESNEITCIEGKWSVPPECKGDSCGIPLELENGFVQNNPKSSYDHGDKVQYKCNSGYSLNGNSQVKCSEGKWSILPQCIDTSCETPNIENAEIISPKKERYTSGEKVQYRCTEGYILHEGVPESTCQDRQWSEPPSCTRALDACGQPPSISNGAIEGSLLSRYKSGQSVTYKCVSYHIMDGSQTVTCLQGRWSELPTCLEPCTASDYEMEANKIILKWLDEDKLYVPHGNQIEFACKHNHVKLPSQNFRVTCIRGHLDYPRCIERGSCVVSLVDLVKNNLNLGKENTEVRHSTTVAFTCKPGFSPRQRGNMEGECYDQRLTYPKCTSATSNRDCGPPPIIQNGDVNGTLLSDYVHGSSVEYQCAKYYRLRDPKPIVCNDGEWSKASECVEPCSLKENKMSENNIQVKWQYRNEKYYEHMDFVEFECKLRHRFSSQSPPLRAQCVNQTLLYPKCS